VKLHGVATYAEIFSGLWAERCCRTWFRL